MTYNIGTYGKGKEKEGSRDEGEGKRGRDSTAAAPGAERRRDRANSARSGKALLPREHRLSFYTQAFSDLIIGSLKFNH